jgi:hypothetical protein
MSSYYSNKAFLVSVSLDTSVTVQVDDRSTDVGKAGSTSKFEFGEHNMTVEAFNISISINDGCVGVNVVDTSIGEVLYCYSNSTKTVYYANDAFVLVMPDNTSVVLQVADGSSDASKAGSTSELGIGDHHVSVETYQITLFIHELSVNIEVVDASIGETVFRYKHNESA